MKKTDKRMKWYYVFTGLAFGLICACMFCGIYGKIASGIILITWTFNGFLMGMNYQRNKENDEIKYLISIVKMLCAEKQDQIEYEKQPKE